MFRPDAIQIAAAWAKARRTRVRRARYQRYRDVEGCQNCGAEAHPGRTRCTECGRRNSAMTIAARKKGNADE